MTHFGGFGVDLYISGDTFAFKMLYYKEMTKN